MAASRGTRVLTGLGGVIIIAAATAILVRGESHGRAQTVDMDSTPITRAPEIRADVRLAVAPLWPPERTYAAYSRLAEHLGSETGHSVLLVQRQTSTQVLELLDEGGAQAALLGAGAFLSARREGLPLQVLAVPVYEEGAVHRALIVTRSDGPLRELEDVRGRAFGFTDPLSITGFQYARNLRLDGGDLLEDALSRSVFTHGHDGSIRAVLDRSVDAAVVDSLVYDFEAERSPSFEGRLRVLHRSPPIGVGPFVVVDSMDQGIRVALRRALLEMQGSADGRSALRAAGALGFVEATAGHFEEASRVAGIEDAAPEP
jgi:phosphonate transport system substrate-binding protein